ncbi:MAG: PDZ domain-containing protein [Acidobacteriota bacterium]
MTTRAEGHDLGPETSEPPPAPDERRPVPPRSGSPLHPLVLGAALAIGLAGILALLPLGPVSAQVVSSIEVEDLDEPAPIDETVDPTIDVDRQEILALYDDAVATYDSDQRPSALPLFGRVVDLIAALAPAAEGVADDARTSGDRSATEPPDAPQSASEPSFADENLPARAVDPIRGVDDELRALWMRALTYRAELHRQLEFEDLARQDLERLLQVSPGTSLDTTVATPDLEKLFAAVRRATVGSVRFLLDPTDARVFVDGRSILEPVAHSTAADALPSVLDAVDPAARDTVDLLAGAHRLEIRRAGYDPVVQALEVDAGREITVEQVLERTSPVLEVTTRPAGASVTLDGELLGVTQGLTEGYSGAADTVYRLDQLSEPLIADGLATGLRILEVRAEGYRPYRAELMIDEAIDYRMPPIVLESERGQLVFNDFPAGATIRIDGEIVEPDIPGASRPRVSLAPGEYLVTVDAGAARMDSTRLRLADRQTIEVAVALRPGLAFLGSLGDGTGDDLDRGIAQNLRRAFDDSARWTLLDRAPEGEPLLRRSGVDADTLRALERPGDDRDAVDWAAVQTAVDRETPGLVYLVAVPSTDLIESGTALWVWSSGPGPAQPERLPVRLEGPDSYDQLRALFDRDLPLRRPWVGALVIDSDAAAHPVIAAVAPSSPAELAGLAVGEQVLGVAGVPVQTAAQFAERIAAAESGESLELAVRGPGTPRATRLQLGTSPWVAVTESSRVRAVAWARLVQLADEVAATERWIVELDQALLLLRAGDADAAARRLRDIRAPQVSHGLGQATVDYWLGVALPRVGPDYLDAAREALERAARVPGARMHHHDDAWVAPRARARLSALAAGIF